MRQRDSYDVAEEVCGFIILILMIVAAYVDNNRHSDANMTALNVEGSTRVWSQDTSP